MTDRERLMVSVYIPSPRDPDLPDGEYYIMDSNERIQRVYISDINPGKMNESTVYGVRYASNGKRYGGDEYGEYAYVGLVRQQDGLQKSHAPLL